MAVEKNSYRLTSDYICAPRTSIHGGWQDYMTLYFCLCIVVRLHYLPLPVNVDLVAYVDL